jgi:hypothetical protein
MSAREKREGKVCGKLQDTTSGNALPQNDGKQLSF